MRQRTTATPAYTPPRLPVVPFNEERPELKEIPFTVRPTVKSTVVNGDVKLKTPFEDPIHNFGGKFNDQPSEHPAKPAHSSYNVDQTDFGLMLETDAEGNIDYMDGGYKGVPNFNFPGLHDDRPDFSTQKPVKNPLAGKVQQHFHKYPAGNTSPRPIKGVVDEESEFDDYTDTDEATFGDLKFLLPNDGSFPDQPVSDSMLRDLPGMGLHPNYPSTEDTLIDLKDLYLKNPFGNDFIRLEVDTDRFRHNKTSSGGIHHIPLLINGYPDIVKKTSRNDDSKKVERPGESPAATKKAGKRTDVARPKRNQRPPAPSSVGRIGSVGGKSRNDPAEAEVETNQPQKPVRTSPPQPVQKKLNRQQQQQQQQQQQPQAGGKKTHPRNSPTTSPTKKSRTAAPTPTATTKSPFVSKVQEKLLQMKNLSNSWVNRGWDLGAAAA